jgi:hypothetical protein
MGDGHEPTGADAELEEARAEIRRLERHIRDLRELRQFDRREIDTLRSTVDALRRRL